MNNYITSYAEGGKVIVWEKEPDGSRTKVTYEPPLYFYVPDTNGDYTSIYGDKLRRETFQNRDDFNKKIDYYKSRGTLLYESDIAPNLKVLSNIYYNRKAPKLNYTLLDIEVDYDPAIGFSSVENPYAPINAVALCHYWTGERVIIAVPPKTYEARRAEWDPQIEEIRNYPNTTLHLVSTETELLRLLLDNITESDVLSGWNSDWFDMPYIAKRIERTLGKPTLQRLSYENSPAPRYREVELFGKMRETIDLYGRISWDYMELFKKFEVSDRPSFSLDAISNEILPELPKLEYNGTLYSLYREDFPHFLRYNYRDTEVLYGFEKKLGYLEVANLLYHMSCGLPANIFGTIKLADLAIINYCHYVKKVIVPDRDENKPDGVIAGAMVLVPQAGLHEWLSSVDVASLYPSAIRTVNISPETLIGQFRGTLSDDDRMKHSAWKAIFEMTDDILILDYDPMNCEKLTGSEQHTAAEWFELIVERGWAISGYGTIYTQAFMGVIPAILTEWFAERKRYKSMMGDAKKKIQKMRESGVVDENQIAIWIDESEYYDRLQYIFKIKLNSLYGALTNFNFRFFDLRLGESTTGTGRCVLDHMCSFIAKQLDNNYSFVSDSIIYGDTDSCYFKTHAALGMEGKTVDEIQARATLIGDTIGNMVNDSFPDFCTRAFRVKPEYSNLVKCEREVIGKRGIFVTKKRYVIKVVNLDGYKVNKLKAMGLEMKKTTTPKPIQQFAENVVNMILDGEASWNEIDDYIINYRVKFHNEFSVFDIGLPKGVKGVETYNQQHLEARAINMKARLPGHVAASIHYNECLELFNDKDSIPIISGTKIRLFYLHKPRGIFKSIAVPTDLGGLPKWMTEGDLAHEFSVNVHLHEEKLIDGVLSKIFVVLNRDVPTAQSRFNDSLLDWD